MIHGTHLHCHGGTATAKVRRNCLRFTGIQPSSIKMHCYLRKLCSLLILIESIALRTSLSMKSITHTNTVCWSNTATVYMTPRTWSYFCSTARLSQPVRASCTMASKLSHKEDPYGARARISHGMPNTATVMPARCPQVRSKCLLPRWWWGSGLGGMRA